MLSFFREVCPFSECPLNTVKPLDMLGTQPIVLCRKVVLFL